MNVVFLATTDSHVRLATLELCIKLLKTLVFSAEAKGPIAGASGGKCYLQDRHLAAVEGAREESTLLLRNFYKVWEKVGENIFISAVPVVVVS